MRARAPRRGQAVAEFALVLPLLLLVLSGTIEFGRAYFAYAQLLQAAHEGARFGAVLPNARNDAAIRARVQQLAPGGTADSVTITSTVSPSNNTPVAANSRTRGNVLTVSVQHTQGLLVPFLPFAQFTMATTTSMVIEHAP